LAMWNAVTPRMRAVDQTIKLAGPSTAGGAGQGAEYLRALMRGATIAPDLITFHAYGSYTAEETDACLLDGAAPSGPGCSQGGIPPIAHGLPAMRAIAAAREGGLTTATVLRS